MKTADAVKTVELTEIEAEKVKACIRYVMNVLECRIDPDNDLQQTIAYYNELSKKF